MNKETAGKVALLMNSINKCERMLSALDGHSYNDEYEIYYRGYHTCDLEDDARQLLVDYYNEEKARLEKELGKL